MYKWDAAASRSVSASRPVRDQELEGGERQGPLLQAQLNLEGAVCLSVCLPACRLRVLQPNSEEGFTMPD